MAIRGRFRLTAVLALAFAVFVLPLARFAAADSRFFLTFNGGNGSSYVVTSQVTWRVDAARLLVGYRQGVAGLSIEQLDRPAAQGTAVLSVWMPTAPRADGYHRTLAWRGSLDYKTGMSDRLPAGRYLVTLVGSVDKSARIVGIASQHPRVVRAPSRTPIVRENSATSALSLGLAPYLAASDVALTLPPDPLVLVEEFAQTSRAAQTWEAAFCLQQRDSACPWESLFSGSTMSPYHETNNGGYYGGLDSNSYYDARWGVRGGQTWFSRLDLRTSKPGASVYQIVVVFPGGNR